MLARAAALVAGASGLVLASMFLYALPATLSLPRGQRPGLKPLSLADAARQLREEYPAGAAQVEAARELVGQRMAYCRRNSFDPYPRAFSRGYGYCQQMALALANLLQCLGYDARVVHCVRNRFPEDRVTSHAWVRVKFQDEEVDLDPLFWDAERREPTFTPLQAVSDFTMWWRLLGGWGSPAVNAHRYYMTGRDL